MKANGIARLGLGCALALASNLGFTATGDGRWHDDVVTDPTAISDAVGKCCGSYDPSIAPAGSNDSTPGVDGQQFRRIDTDLLKLPQEYFRLARSPARGFARGYPEDGISLASAGDVLRLDVDRYRDALGRSRGLLTPPRSTVSHGLTPLGLDCNCADINGPDFAGNPARSVNPPSGGAWRYLSAVLALVSPMFLPKPELAEPAS